MKADLGSLSSFYPRTELVVGWDSCVVVEDGAKQTSPDSTIRRELAVVCRLPSSQQGDRR